MGDYGYLHTARVVGLDVASGGWFVESVALARDRRWGPIPSCVLGLQPGDKVVLAATGTTRDNLLILGPLDPRYPDIGDIPGLTAALALKADQTALDAAVANITTEHNTNVTQNTRLDGIDALNTTQNSRLTAAEGVNTTQDGRLTTVEGRATTIEGVNTTQDASITSLNSSVTDLLTWEVFQAHDRDAYGDAFSSFPRMFATNSRTLVNQAAYIFRTRVRKTAALTQIRMAVATTAGVGGTTTGAVYRSLSATGANGPYSLLNSGTNALSAVGRQNFTVASSSFARGDYLLILLLLNNSYTTLPKMAAAQSNVIDGSILNPTSAGVVFGTKTGVTSVPATISPNDGTWTAEPNPWWIAAT
jgi:hypothetical protein